MLWFRFWWQKWLWNSYHTAYGLQFFRVGRNTQYMSREDNNKTVYEDIQFILFISNANWMGKLQFFSALHNQITRRKWLLPLKSIRYGGIKWDWKRAMSKETTAHCYMTYSCGIHINIYAKKDQRITKQIKVLSLSVPQIRKELHFKIVFAVTVIRRARARFGGNLLFSHWTTIIIIIMIDNKDIETTNNTHTGCTTTHSENNLTRLGTSERKMRK